MKRARMILNAIVLVAVSLMLIGCRTLEGAGKDIETAGKAIQEEARE